MDTLFPLPRKNERKIYSALYRDGAHLSVFGDVQTVNEPEDLKTSNAILILHGGADISPSIYKQKVSSFTHAGDTPSERDRKEINLLLRAIEMKIPVLGICRGAQLACAIAGGTLVQHVDNHATGTHKIETGEGEVLEVSSCHHQMLYPWKIKHELLAWSAPARSQRYIGEDDAPVEMEKEPEIVYLPEIQCLAIQGHPEWMARSSPLVQHMLNLVEEKLL